MSMMDIELPSLGGHPTAPQISLETFERYGLDVFMPNAIAHFKNNEGSQTTPWTNFGAE
jgi:hypothetical protein